MLKLFAKNMIFVFLLTVVGGQFVHAEVKHYQYDGKLPFVQMMLNMMTAMGIIDRIPVNGRYGRYGNYGNYGNYGRYGRYGASPYSSSSWLQPEYGGYNLESSPWGSPTWGVLPPESYALDGWVNESWETSQWNPKSQIVQRSMEVPQQSTANQQSQNVPVLQNQTSQNQRPQNYSPLAKIAQPNQYRVPPDAIEHGRQSSSPSNNQVKQKPCITDSCGLKKPNLNGLWVSQNGEMLGIKANTYLWSDGDSRYLTGIIKVENEYLVTSIEGHDQLLRFKYKFSGNNLLTMEPNGEVREFVRMSANQYQNYRQNYEYYQNQEYSNPEYHQNYYGEYY